MAGRICIVQIQPRKHELVHPNCTAPTRQHELDHTDIQIIQIMQITNIPALKDLDHRLGVDDLSDV